ESKYGKLFASISEGITGSREDALECVNDTYLRLWNSIPPERPANLKAYGGRIVRNVSINRAEHDNAKRRGGGEILVELDETVPDRSDAPCGEISGLIDSFLRKEDRESRVTFVLRYWYCAPLDEIARRLSISESAVKSRLFRTRKKLKSYLEKEGVSL
ncbi:MAG: RNA polymerase sigma factor, partial [Clostridia bacterium]|nr:RNA polymerase sigma factor [Clostridia bacterium]